MAAQFVKDMEGTGPEDKQAAALWLREIFAPAELHQPVEHASCRGVWLQKLFLENPDMDDDHTASDDLQSHTGPAISCAAARLPQSVEYLRGAPHKQNYFHPIFQLPETLSENFQHILEKLLLSLVHQDLLL